MIRFDGSTLGGKAPTALAKARNLAHHAVQWPTRAARANLTAVPDDSHSSLEWDSERAALFSRPLPTGGGDVRVGLRLAGLAVIILRGAAVLDTFELFGRRDSMVGVWLDSALRALGLKPASGVTLPYSIHSNAVARGSPYSLSGEFEAFDELARWFGAAAELLGDFKTTIASAHADTSPIVCWPHHFDIAMVVSFDADTAQSARSIGIGLSPGDELYDQPYVYISPSPQLNTAQLPELPPPGHWHTQGFVGAVATGEAILALENRGPGLLTFIKAAFEIGCAHLGA
jgi:hypothetical protein